MPGKVYLKGFVKSYAKFLDIDNNEQIIEFLEQEAHSPVEQQTIPKYEVEIPKKFNNKKFLTLILGVIAILLLWGVQTIYHSYFQDKSSQIGTTPPAEDKLPMTNPEEKPLTTEPPEIVKPDKVTLKIEITDIGTKKDACWLQVFSDEKLIFEGTMYENENKVFEAKEKIRLVLGNAGAVKLTLGEKDLGIAGQIGKVVEKEFTLADMGN